MSNPRQIELLSDDDDDGGHCSCALATTVSNKPNRPRTEFHSNSTPLFIIDDDPTPSKLPTPASSARSSLPQLSFPDSPKTRNTQTLVCKSRGGDDPSSGSSSLPRISGFSGLICLESDDEADESLARGNQQKRTRYKQWPNGETRADFDEEIHFEKSSGDIDSMHCVDKDLDHVIENVGLGQESANCTLQSRSKANSQLKQNRERKVTNRKKSIEDKTRLMEEKKLKKQQEQLHKAALKAETARSRQLEKDKQRWEKEFDKNILTEIDPKVLQCGSIGGHLLTRFGEKGLRFNITSNPIEKSIVWRMNIPEELSQLSSLGTDMRYVLLIYGAEEFCKVALDGSIMDHISAVKKHYPSYAICCLTCRLMSYINKREQDQYRNRKFGSDWQRPPVEEVFAKLTTHFANVHSRHCADEAELADHVVGLTINLAKCCFRKKLTPIFLNANECNVPKDYVDRDLILKNTWLKMLAAIPKVQPRFAIGIWKKYPTMKSLLNVYTDPTKSVYEKESLLKDLMMEGILGNEDRKVGEICSKRVYRVLMAQNGSTNTGEIENGADYFRTN